VVAFAESWCEVIPTGAIAIRRSASRTVPRFDSLHCLGGGLGCWSRAWDVPLGDQPDGSFSFGSVRWPKPGRFCKDGWLIDLISGLWWKAVFDRPLGFGLRPGVSLTTPRKTPLFFFFFIAVRAAISRASWSAEMQAALRALTRRPENSFPQSVKGGHRSTLPTHGERPTPGRAHATRGGIMIGRTAGQLGEPGVLNSGHRSAQKWGYAADEGWRFDDVDGEFGRDRRRNERRGSGTRSGVPQALLARHQSGGKPALATDISSPGWMDRRGSFVAGCGCCDVEVGGAVAGGRRRSPRRNGTAGVARRF